MSAPSETVTAPLRIGRYEIIREVGRGGMAVLFEARHVQLGIRLALKRPLASLADGGVAEARFRNEAIYAAKIRHPNVIRIHDYGTDAGAPYIAMELLEGVPLSGLLASREALPVARAVDLLLGVLRGVAAVHAAGITHRDLKPHNVLVARDTSGREHPVIIDFGIAKSVFDGPDPTETQGLTTSGATIGTAAYMAPEQILCAKDVGPLADQYALGVTLYECLTATLPFAGASAYEAMHATLNTRPHAPSELRPEIPRALDDVILRALSRAPEERFPSVHSMGEALLPFAGEDAALAWEAEARLTRPADDREAGPSVERHTVNDRVPVSAPAGRRFDLRWVLATAVVAGAAGAASATFLMRSARATSDDAVGVKASSLELPLCAAPSTPAPLDTPPLAGRAASIDPDAEVAPRVPSAVPPPAPPKLSHRNTKADERTPSRGTNGAPILE